MNKERSQIHNKIIIKVNVNHQSVGSRVLCRVNRYVALASTWYYKLTFSYHSFDPSAFKNMFLTQTDGYGSLPKTIHCSIFVPYKSQSFYIVWPAWSVLADISVPNKSKAWPNLLHNKMPYPRDALEIYYLLGTMSNAIKHKVWSSSQSRYGVKDQYIVGIQQGSQVPH